MATLSILCGYLICGFVGLLGLAVLWRIFDGTIDLSRLISEPTGDASMSRFQFLIFTFVIALSLFLVIVAGKNTDCKICKPALPDSIPTGILSLLGISGSSYLVSKGIQYSDPSGVADRPVTVTIMPSTVLVRYSQSQQFQAEVTRKPDSKVQWAVVAGPGSIDAETGLYRAPAVAPTEPGPQVYATVKATCVEFPDATDLAVITLA